MATDLTQVAQDRGITYFLISFVDLFGVLRAKLVPAAAIGEMQQNGAGFAGFATWLDMTPADPGMFAIPDSESLMQLPWQPEIGWLAADLWLHGQEVEAPLRVALKRPAPCAQRLPASARHAARCRHHGLTRVGAGLEKCVWFFLSSIGCQGQQFTEEGARLAPERV
jgi:hypothetical protein